VIGTLSKALCSCGGFVAGSAPLVDLLRHTAPGFVYSVGLSVPNAAAARAALAAIRADPGRVARLRRISARFREAVVAAGLDPGANAGFAVAPVLAGDSVTATWLAEKLLGDGVNVMPIIAPAVPNRAARLRFFLNAEHSDAAVRHAVESTARRLGDARRLIG
jgi:7-keto-8-aminopelargonate synthetase-like enzyme